MGKPCRRGDVCGRAFVMLFGVVSPRKGWCDWPPFLGFHPQRELRARHALASLRKWQRVGCAYASAPLRRGELAAVRLTEG